MPAAFPGAYGWGAESIGGRGGAIITVDNLDDSGAGSLRAALTTEGARIVIPRVAGTITLSSTITISNPLLTFAGQAAPGSGLWLRGPSGGTAIQIDTSDGSTIGPSGYSNVELFLNGPEEEPVSVVDDLTVVEAALRAEAAAIVAQADAVARAIVDLEAIDDVLDAAADVIVND